MGLILYDIASHQFLQTVSTHKGMSISHLATMRKLSLNSGSFEERHPYTAWDAHYRQVHVLKFTDNGTAIISGSEDSRVSVWFIARFAAMMHCPCYAIDSRCGHIDLSTTIHKISFHAMVQIIPYPCNISFAPSEHILLVLCSRRPWIVV
jgi:WD40 repeat protein